MASFDQAALDLFLDHLDDPNLMTEIAKMSAGKRDILLDMLFESAEFGWSDSYTKMVKIDWLMEPASPREFLTDPYYKDPEATIYPLLIDYLDDALSDPMIYEIIMTARS